MASVMPRRSVDVREWSDQLLAASPRQTTEQERAFRNLVDAVNALISDHNTLRTKLNADAGVTDTNYAASTSSTVKITRG